MNRTAFQPAVKARTGFLKIVEPGEIGDQLVGTGKPGKPRPSFIPLMPAL